MSLENRAQLLKTLRISSCGSVYIYTPRFYAQHAPRINLHRSPTLFMQKLTFTDFFLEKLSYEKVFLSHFGAKTMISLCCSRNSFSATTGRILDRSKVPAKLRRILDDDVEIFCGPTLYTLLPRANVRLNSKT